MSDDIMDALTAAIERMDAALPASLDDATWEHMRDCLAVCESLIGAAAAAVGEMREPSQARIVAGVAMFSARMLEFAAELANDPSAAWGCGWRVIAAVCDVADDARAALAVSRIEARGVN